MAPPPVRGIARFKQRLSGLAMLVVIISLLALSVAFYQKAFTPVTKVTLQANRAGNQLTEKADVKVRGVLIGEVRKVESTGDGARLQLALIPEEAKKLSPEVKVQLIPKTLFGEKFVAIEPPTGPATGLKENDVIAQDQSQTALETEEAFDNLMPLLQELRPDRLSMTLNAVSSAVRGRGDRLGRTLEQQNELFKGYNEVLPDFQRDLVGLADFADNLDRAAPDLLSFLDSTAFSSRALVEQEPQLQRFLEATDVGVQEINRFLTENEQRLIRLPRESNPPLQLYARYSPEFPCMLKGLTQSEITLEKTFGGNQPGLHITLEPTNDLNEYEPNKDEPKNTDTVGPTCRGLPPNKPDRSSATGTFPFYRNGGDGYRDGESFDPNTGRTSSDATEGQNGPAPLPIGAGASNMYGVPQDRISDASLMLATPVMAGRA